MGLIIQKYGGSSVATIEQIDKIAIHIKHTVEQGHKVIAVVSAMGKYTDELLETAHKVNSNPPLREIDMLLTAGERVTMSLLSIALHKHGMHSRSLTGSQSGILTDNTHGNAKIVKILGQRIREGITESAVVIVAGFQGVCPETKDITTLGRGGTDLSAIALAQTLQADSCELYKDTGHIMTADPRIVANAKPIHHISWNSMCELTWNGAGVLQHRGANLALKYSIPIKIMSNLNMTKIGTIIEGKVKMENPNVEAITTTNKICQMVFTIPNTESDLKTGNEVYGNMLQKLWDQGEAPIISRLNQGHNSAAIEILVSDKNTSLMQSIIDKSNLKYELSIKSNLAIISIIGNGFKQNPSLINKAVTALSTPPRMTELHNHSMVLCIPVEHLNDSVNRLHEALIVNQT